MQEEQEQEEGRGRTSAPGRLPRRLHTRWRRPRPHTTGTPAARRAAPWGTCPKASRWPPAPPPTARAPSATLHSSFPAIYGSSRCPFSLPSLLSLLSFLPSLLSLLSFLPSLLPFPSFLPSLFPFPSSSSPPSPPTSGQADEFQRSRTHVTASHNGGLGCDMCEARLATSYSLKRHKSAKHGQGISCDTCSLVLSTQSALDKHLLQVHLIGDRCANCPEVLLLRGTLDKHRRLCPAAGAAGGGDGGGA